MKVLLRNAQTKLYFGARGDWVAEAAEAVSFMSLEQAGEAAIEHGDLDVVLRYDDPGCELAINPVFCVGRK